MSNFTVYRASAGSGKTFSLVIEYLTIALADSSGKTYRKILGVTFTNKAAGELKERIIRFLKSAAVPVNHADHNVLVVEKLTQNLGISQQELSIRAQKTLTDILHNYSRLSISTIDKFVHRLIRSFARELKLQGDFEIELDAKRVYEKVAQRVINLIGQDEHLTKWIIQWLLGRLEENKGAGNYEGELVKFLENIGSDEAGPFKEKLLAISLQDLKLAKENLLAFTTNFESKAFSIGAIAWKLICDAGLGIEDFTHTRTGPGAFFKKLADKQAGSFIAGPRIIGIFEKGKLYTEKKGSALAVEQVTPELIELYQQLQHLVSADLQKYQLSVLLRKELDVLGLAGKLEEILQAYLEEKNIVLISDFNEKIAEVVVNEPAPFIYELLGERYDHFLIDEFQDTSILQWQNFLPLVDNSLGKGGKTLVVGDGKQSIYRFRGGEVEQFQQLPEIYQAPSTPIFEQYSAALRRNHSPETITKNYRSASNVVSFNNDYVDSLQTFLSERYRPIYSDGKQTPNVKEEGYVFIKALEKDPDLEDSLDKLNLEQLLADIKRLLEKGYSYRDCCVLVNKNDWGTLIARELLANNIPIISEESLTVLFSPKARLLLGCFQLLNDSTSGIGQLNVIENAVWLKLLTGDVISVFRKHCFKVKSDKNKHMGCEVTRLFADLGIKGSLETIKAKNLYSLAEFIARTLGFMDSCDPFVQFFLDQTLVCMQKEGNHLADYIKWWETNADSAKVVMPDGLDAVRIMTIHKSKGLEFENVFLPFVHWKSRPSKDVLWIEPGETFSPLEVALVPNSASKLLHTGFEYRKELEDEKDKLDDANKLYVGLTRAARNLFIYTGPRIEKSGICPHFYNWVINRSDFDPTTFTLEIGQLHPNPEKKENKHTVENSPIVLEKFISNYDESKLIIGYQAPKFWDAENTSTEKDHGNIVHELLNDIHCMADLDPVVEKYSRSGVLQAEELDVIYATLKKIIALGEKEGWLGAKLNGRNEMELLSLADGSPEIIRPDRVVFHTDFTWVIDYKTGTQLPTHLDQLQKYMRALTEIKMPDVRGKLVYVETAITIELN